MGELKKADSFQTLKVKWDDDICVIQIHRPEANNMINNELIREMAKVLRVCNQSAKVVVVEGLPEVFCLGADFEVLRQSVAKGTLEQDQEPGPLYDLWLQLATGPYLSIAHVQGKANAGGIGFVAACDMVISKETAVFSLSELLFGLMPACVMPFLARRIGFPKANYMTLLTQPVKADQAHDWGLVDAFDTNSTNLLRKHLLRLRLLSKSAIARHKAYMNQLNPVLTQSKEAALSANRKVFSDADNLKQISRYVTTGKFPWEEG